MANRIVENVIIIDTNGAIATQPATNRYSYKVASIGFWSANSTALIQVAAAANTANILFNLQTNIAAANFQIFQVGGHFTNELTVLPSFAAGTAWFYLV